MGRPPTQDDLSAILVIYNMPFSIAPRFGMIAWSIWKIEQTLQTEPGMSAFGGRADMPIAVRNLRS